MSTNALAYLLLTKFRDGVTIDRLVVAMDDLRKDLDYARKDLGFSGDSIDVINYAVSILKSCINGILVKKTNFLTKIEFDFPVI